MYRLNLLSLTAALTLGLGAATTGFADLYYVGDTAANAAVAGGGAWNNSTVNWSTNTPAGTKNSAWTPGGDAQFQGTAGGTVTVGDNLNVGSATFTAVAGSFTISNSYDIEVNGAGISNNSLVTQTVTNPGGTINFNNSSSASGGSAPVTYSTVSTLNFNNSSTAGNASINNSGVLTFNNTATGGSASVTNSSFMDISGLSTTGISLSSLNNSGSVTLGTGAGGAGKSLGLTSLTEQGGSEVEFTLGTASSLITAGSVTDSASPSNQIGIDTDAGAGFGLSLYTLINDVGGTLNLNDYVLNSAPVGYTLAVLDSGHNLDLVAVPEISSFLLPVLGAASLVIWLRRRRNSVMDSMIAGSAV